MVQIVSSKHSCWEMYNQWIITAELENVLLSLHGNSLDSIQVESYSDQQEYVICCQNNH